MGNDSVSGGSTGVSVGHHTGGTGGIVGGVGGGVGGVSGDIKPRSLRFTWSMKTTSSRDPNEIMAEIKKVYSSSFSFQKIRSSIKLLLRKIDAFSRKKLPCQKVI